MGPGDDLWDTKVTGFGARRQRSSAISYVVMYRADGRLRRHTIGRHGAPWTPDSARKEARRILGSVASGSDPATTKAEARSAPTVSALCDSYFKDAESGRLLTRRRAAKKASTLATDKGRIERHIKPQLGSLKVAAVTRADIERFMHAVADGETAARVKTVKRGLARVTGGRGASSRTVGLLGGIFAYAVRRGMRDDNPVRGVERFADGKRNRRLSDDEYAALGAGMTKLDNVLWPPALAAARFLALTGWRSGEAIKLTRAEVDISRQTASLGDTKTGASTRPLSTQACAIIKAQGKAGDLVFAASRGNSVLSGFPKLFAKIVTAAKLSSDVTPHVLRHSYASVASDLGYSEATIAALLGHRSGSVTSRYIHSADAVLLAASDAIASRIATLMTERNGSAHE